MVRKTKHPKELKSKIYEWGRTQFSAFNDELQKAKNEPLLRSVFVPIPFREPVRRHGKTIIVRLDQNKQKEEDKNSDEYVVVRSRADRITIGTSTPNFKKKKLPLSFDFV